MDEARQIGSETVEVLNLEDEVVVRYTFSVEEAGDVRQMLVSAAGVRGKTPDHDDHWMKMVLLAQADMVTKGLHIRDHDFPDLLGDVNAFHAKFGQEYTGKPRMLPADLHDFRVKFHDEETHEYRDEYPKLVDAVERKDRRDILNTLELQLDALCDAIWVVLGTADLQFGRKVFFEAWKRVVAANMAKVRVEVKDDGERNCAETGRAAKFDIGKPAGWVAPDHRDLVQDNAIFDELFGEPPEEAEFNGTAQKA
jgi:predicted HAD superfamily Cof-like phosphohydrolase